MNEEKKPNGTQPRIELKSVRHSYSPEERNELGSSLARSIGTMRGIETEFDQVKASFKARITEAESQIETLSTSLMNGFEYRQKRCRVVFNPALRKKAFFLEEDTLLKTPVLIEDMTNEDFQEDLFRAEAKFHHREEIELFPAAGNDRAIMVVGKWGDKWYAALRAQIGRNKLEERLDSEQPCCVKRIDMITKAAGRFDQWITETAGKDAAKGFRDHLGKVLEAHKEREE